MDTETLELLREGVRHVLSEPDERPFAARLEELGWDEVLADDECTATDVLFVEKGGLLSAVDALDLVQGRMLAGWIPHLDAGSTVIVHPDDLDPARRTSSITDGRLQVSGVALRECAPGDILVVPADGADGLALAVLEGHDIETTVLDGIDSDLGLRRIRATVALDEVALCDGDSAREAWDAVVSVGRCAVAAELIGLAGRTLEIAVEHALDRFQFGRPIGSFQALQHRLADAHVAITAAAAVLNEAWRGQDPWLAAAAKALAGRAGESTMAAAQQVLGGLGFAWEHPFHRYLRRAIALDALLGSGRGLEREMGLQLLETRLAPRLGAL